MTSSPSDAPTLNLAAYSAAAVASVAIIVGSLGPWVTLQTPLTSLSINGTDTADGKLGLFAACIAGAALLIRTAWRSMTPFVIALVCGILCVAVGFVGFTQDWTDLAGEYQRISTGWGLWLVRISSATLVLASILCLAVHSKERRSGAVTTGRQAEQPQIVPAATVVRRKSAPALLKPHEVGILAVCCVATAALLIAAVSIGT